MSKSIKTIVKIYLSTLCALQLCRLLFIVTYLSRSMQLGLIRVLNSMAHGFIQDLTIAGWVVLPLVGVVSATLISRSAITSNPLQRIVKIYLIAVAAVFAAVIAVDITLFGYWGYRLDATLLPYLTTPAEATASVSLRDVSVGVLIFLAAFIPTSWLYVKSLGAESEERGRVGRFSWLWLLLLVAVIVGGNTVRLFVNVHFSSTLLSNQIAVNPIYSLASTLGDGQINSDQYQFFSIEDELEMHFCSFTGNKGREPIPIVNNRRPNVAIIICESYSRSIMDLDIAIDGGEDSLSVMPNLRRIANEGIALESAIASGVRTDKGLVSILSGFVSQPKISLLNYPDKSVNLPSIASTLGREGYGSSFYYGGNLDYMNMRQYLSGTGWQSLVDRVCVESSSEKPQRWGWSDGVMMERFADDLIAQSKGESPFVTTLLTLSSHEPFDTPKKMGFATPLFDAMAYSDAELGRLYDRLRESEAWDDLLLIIVGDHATNYPRTMSYDSPARHHIPLIFSGGAVEMPVDEPYFDMITQSVVSQCDIVGTILAQMGLDSGEYIFSRDIFDIHSAQNSYAYYTFNNGFGIVKKSGSVLYDVTSDIAAITFRPIDDKATYTKGILLTPSDWSHFRIGQSVLQRTFDEIEKL